MSVANVFCQADAGYMLTDSGIFHMDGRIARLECKVLELSSLRAAITTRGHIAATGRLARRIGLSRVTDGDQLVAILPGILRGMMNRRGAQLGGRIADRLRTDITVLWYSPARERVIAAVISSGAAGMPDEYQPYDVVPVREAWQPGVDMPEAIGRQADATCAAQFDPRADGLAVMEAQRRQTWAFNGIPNGHHAAGDVRLTQVNHKGVSTSVINRWPDHVGLLVRLGP